MPQQESIGSFTANAQNQPLNVSGLKSLIATITGTFNLTLQFEASVDGSNWVNVKGYPLPSGVPVTSITGTGVGTWRFSVAGFRFFRLRVSAYTSGTMVYAMWATDAEVAEDSAGQPSVQGNVAHDSAIAGNPVRTGARARTSNVTAVANDDVVDNVATVTGVQVVRPYSIPEAEWSYAAASGGIVNTSDVAIKAAAGAGLRNYLTSLQLKNSHASVATEVVVKDGSTIIWRGHTNANMPNTDTIEFPIPLKSTANAALNVACITTGAAVYANAQGYVAP